MAQELLGAAVGSQQAFLQPWAYHGCQDCLEHLRLRLRALYALPKRHVMLAWRIDSGSWVQAAGALRGVNVQRITFNEVTQQAVRQALAAPRNVRSLPDFSLHL